MTMGVSVVTYTVADENSSALVANVQNHLVPAARTTSGYRGMALLDMGGDERMAILIFDSPEDVPAAQEALTPVGRDHTYRLMSGPAIGAVGRVVVADGVFAAEPPDH